MPLTEDLTVFFDTTEFATAATYLPAAGGSSAVNGVFDREWIDVQGVDMYAPTFKCAAITGAAIGDQITIGTTTYDVVSLQHDNTKSLDVLVLQE